MEIHDTGGDPEYGSNRKMVYKGADLFLLCVSADRKDYRKIGDEPNSILATDQVIEASIKEFVDEIRVIDNQKPIALLLTKDDLRSTGDQESVISDEFMVSMKKKYSMQFYKKTSAKRQATTEGDWSVCEAFDTAIYAASKYKEMLAQKNSPKPKGK